MKLLSRFFQSAVCIGVLISDTRIQALALGQINRPYKILWSSAVSSDAPLLTNPDGYATLRKELSKLAAKIFTYSRGRIPIQLALADPILQAYFLEFESLPNSDAERRSLVAWQLGKQYHIDCQKLTMTCQYTGKGVNSHRMLSLSVDTLLIDIVMGVFREANLTPTVLDAGASYLYNVLARIVRSKNAMIIIIEDAYWTIMIWDGYAGLQYMRSRWHSIANDPLAAYQDLSMEIERTARAFVYHREGRSIGAIHLCGDDIHTSALYAQFHDKAKEYCEIHDGKSLFSENEMNGEYPGWTVLASSLCRSS